MIKKLLKLNETLPLGLDLIRVISGAIIISFGFEMFSSEQMAGYHEWLTTVGMPIPKIMAYVGKFAELIGGFCLAIGLFTRLSAIPLMVTMCVINFIMLEGNLRTEPFYLFLIFTSFLFLGSGKMSVDFFIWKKISASR